MAHRITNFSSAESMNEIEASVKALADFKSQIQRVQLLLQNGNFAEAFEQARRADERLKVATRRVMATNNAQLKVGLVQAQAVMQRVWSQFDAQDTGRANFSGALDDLGDAASGLTESAKEKIKQGKAIVSAAGEVKDEVGNVIGMVKDTKDWFEKAGSPPPVDAPPGTVFLLPTCLPAEAFASQPPMLVSIFNQLGISACAAYPPAVVACMMGDSTEVLRSKIANARRIQEMASPRPTGGTIPQRIGPTPLRADLNERLFPGSSAGAGSEAKSSTGLLVAGGLAAAFFLLR